MSESIISEGKTTSEAIEKGLKILKVSRDKVDIKVLDNEEKRSFFSILTPRVVKVELTVKDGATTTRETRSSNSFKKERVQESRPIVVDEKELEIGKKNVIAFLNDFTSKFESLEYKIDIIDSYISVHITGEDSSRLIGYRGETLNAIQVILSSVANKKINSRIKIILNIADYKERRQKALEELAEKVSKTVLRTGKQVVLEPMPAYERKVIHSKLQLNEDIKTYSIGDEPYRKVVITKK